MHLLATPQARAIRLPALTRYRENTTGNANTAVGDEALRHNTTGSAQHGPRKVAPSLATQPASRTRPWVMSRSPITPTVAPTRPWVLGALPFNTTGDSNTATGFRRTREQHHRREQYGHGWQALQSNTTGNGNTAVGSQALHAAVRQRGSTASTRLSVFRRS